MPWLKRAIVAMSVAMLCACGGSDGEIDLSGGSDNTTNPDGTTGGSGSAKPSLNIALYDNCSNDLLNESNLANGIEAHCSPTNIISTDNDTYVLLSLKTNGASNSLVDLSTDNAVLAHTTVLVNDAGLGYTTLRAKVGETNADAIIASYAYSDGENSSQSITATSYYQIEMTDGSNAENSLSLSLYNCDGIDEDKIPQDCSSSRELAIGSPLTVVATLLQAGGTPAENEIIELSSNNATLTAERILTNSMGIAFTNLVAKNGVSGADQLSAINETLAVANNINYQIKVTSGSEKPSLALKLYDCDGVANNSIPQACEESFDLAIGSPLTVVATLLHAGGNPAANELIDLSTGSATLASARVLTNAQGVAFTQLIAKSGVSGADKLSAINDTLSVANSTNYQIITSSDIIEPSLRLELYDCNGIDENESEIPIDCISTNKLSVDTPLTVVATLLKAGDVPAANELIRLDTSTATLSPASVLTNENGVAITTLSADYDDFGADVLNATNETYLVGDSINYQVEVSDETDTQAALELRLYDCVDVPRDDIPELCNEAANLSIETPLTAVATLRYAGGKPAANEIITFDTSHADLSTKRTLSNDEGRAIVTLFAKLEANGADTLLASNDTLNVEESANYELGQANLKVTLSSGLLDGEELAIDATTRITLAVTDANDEPYMVPIVFNMSSICAANDEAKLPESVTTINGIATAIYEPNGCRGSDTITATPTLSILEPQQLHISIATSKASMIEFVEALPAQIFLKESVGASTSTLTFKVTDRTGQPKQGQRVNFSLDSDMHGLSLSPSSKESDANGEVTTIVTSGDMPGSIVVTASFTDEESDVVVSSVSNALSIHSGVPVQKNFSLSSSLHAQESWNVDGVKSALTIHVADENGNPVPDNTAVYFEAEGGQVTGSCATEGQDSISKCEVLFVSQDNRPQGHDNSLNEQFGGVCMLPGFVPAHGKGRVTVQAVTIGQETFFDADGNRVFDGGETYQELSEAWLDANENGEFDTSGIWEFGENVGERFRDYNPNSEFDAVTGKKNGSVAAADVKALYNGLMCRKDDEEDGLCTRELIEVRDSLTMLMASGNANISLSHVVGSYITDGISNSTLLYVENTASTLIFAGDVVSIAGVDYLVTADSDGSELRIKGGLASTVEANTEITHYPQSGEEEDRASFIVKEDVAISFTTLQVTGGNGEFITGDLVTIDDQTFLVSKGGNGQFTIAGSFDYQKEIGASVTREPRSEATEIDLTLVPSYSLILMVQDINGNQMPAGTKVTVTTDNGELSSLTSFEVNDGTRLCDTHILTVGRETDSNGKKEGLLTVKVVSPSGVETYKSIKVIDAE